MINSTGRKKFIGFSFVFYLGIFYGGINLYLNDKLRAEMEAIISSGRRKEERKVIHERLAGSYEKKTEKFEIRNQFNKYRRVLVSYAKGKTLECGVGTGRSLEFYKNDADVIGIDYDSKMLEQAKAKLDERAAHNISPDAKIVLTKLDCEELKENFPADFFDTVVDINNISCYDDYNKVYEGIKHVMKDDGIFVFLARGQSTFRPIQDFYKIFRPFVFMKQGQDLTINWSEFIEQDKDWEILYKERKNYGRTYIYVLKLHKNRNTKI
jgi:ubiquinone/menaquinone biosynthesis C-methylase UbiE